jgi:hypothetical protein
MPVDDGNVTMYCTSLTDSFFLCVFVASSRGTISIRKSKSSFFEIAAATSFRWNTKRIFILFEKNYY